MDVPHDITDGNIVTFAIIHLNFRYWQKDQTFWTPCRFSHIQPEMYFTVKHHFKYMLYTCINSRRIQKLPKRPCYIMLCNIKLEIQVESHANRANMLCSCYAIVFLNAPSVYYLARISYILMSLHPARSEDLTRSYKTPYETFASLLRDNIMACNISTLGLWRCCRRNIAIQHNFISERCGSYVLYRYISIYLPTSQQTHKRFRSVLNACIMTEIPSFF